MKCANIIRSGMMSNQIVFAFSCNLTFPPFTIAEYMISVCTYVH